MTISLRDCRALDLDGSVEAIITVVGVGDGSVTLHIETDELSLYGDSVGMEYEVKLPLRYGGLDLGTYESFLDRFCKDEEFRRSKVDPDFACECECRRMADKD